MSDKWTELTGRIKNGMIAEEPEAILSACLELFAEFGRALELIGIDTDRFATAAERLVSVAEKTAEPTVTGEPAKPEVLDL